MAPIQKLHHFLSPVHVKDRSSRRTTVAFVKGQAVTEKIFFVVQKHFLVLLACALKDFETRKSTKMLVRRWKGSFDQDAS